MAMTTTDTSTIAASGRSRRAENLGRAPAAPADAGSLSEDVIASGSASAQGSIAALVGSRARNNPIRAIAGAAPFHRHLTLVHGFVTVPRHCRVLALTS